MIPSRRGAGGKGSKSNRKSILALFNSTDGLFVLYRVARVVDMFRRRAKVGHSLTRKKRCCCCCCYDECACGVQWEHSSSLGRHIIWPNGACTALTTECFIVSQGLLSMVLSGVTTSPRLFIMRFTKLVRLCTFFPIRQIRNSCRISTSFPGQSEKRVELWIFLVEPFHKQG